MTDTSQYNILFADSFTYRHQQLRVRSGTTTRNVYQSHVYTAEELSKCLLRKRWDVVFVAGYYEKHDSLKDLIRAFCVLPEGARARLVIYHGTTDDQHFVRQLRNVGYLATHIPWDFMNPNLHERKDPKVYLPAEDNIQQLLLPTAAREEAS